MTLKKWQFICPDCLQPTDKGGTGRRKRCIPCADKHHKKEVAAWCKANYYYDHKRGPHKPKGDI